MKHIYISPHSDDVALSCGARIISGALSRSDTLVLNVFTSDSRYASNDTGKRDDNFANAINDSRTAEDEAAWESLGIETRYLNLPEALLRRTFPFAIFSQKLDEFINNQLYGILASHVKEFPGAVWYFPAGFGSHVDHLICQKVAFRLLDESLVDKIVLYEDLPYSWLRFIRFRYYKALARTVKFDGSSSNLIFRREGLGILDYLTGKIVPFPRGKKLFPIVCLSLVFGNLFHKGGPVPKPYAGRLNSIVLDSRQMARKSELLSHYKSQIPMLFGTDPDALLRTHPASFSTEVTIEITRAT